jgi:hypothetical protein
MTTNTDITLLAGRNGKRYRYRIYRNLHDGTWTVQHHVKGTGWRKLEGVAALWCPHAVFKVYDSGRDRCRRELKKYVHAYALTNSYTPLGDDAQSRMWDLSTYGVTYTPYNDKGFTTADGSGRNLSEVWGATFASFGHIGVERYAMGGDLAASTLV